MSFDTMWQMVIRDWPTDDLKAMRRLIRHELARRQKANEVVL